MGSVTSRGCCSDAGRAPGENGVPFDLDATALRRDLEITARTVAAFSPGHLECDAHDAVVTF
ncbi:MAG TPA: hypothetical protein VK869_07165 [Rubrobacteraceae bacterium]|nr:hypothetical protein [Rubrobacteraceae bacterium]